MYTYNKLNSTIITYLNGDALGLNNYSPPQEETLKIGNTTFEGGDAISNVVNRGYYTIYAIELNKTQVKDLYATFLLKEYSLTLKEGTVALTITINGELSSLLYNPLV